MRECPPPSPCTTAGRSPPPGDFICRRALRHPPGRGRAGWEACRADYEVRRASFSHLTVEFVAKGEGEAELAGVRFPLRAGVIYVYDRTVPHRITAGEGGMVKYFALLRGPAARKLLARAGSGSAEACTVTRPDRIREIWDDLIEMGFGDRSDREEACADTLRYLILKIGDLMTPKGRAPRSPTPPTSAAARRWRSAMPSS